MYPHVSVQCNPVGLTEASFWLVKGLAPIRSCGRGEGVRRCSGARSIHIFKKSPRKFKTRRSPPSSMSSRLRLNIRPCTWCPIHAPHKWGFGRKDHDHGYHQLFSAPPDGARQCRRRNDQGQSWRGRDHSRQRRRLHDRKRQGQGCQCLRSLWQTFRHGDVSLVGQQILQEDLQSRIPPRTWAWPGRNLPLVRLPSRRVDFKLFRHSCIVIDGIASALNNFIIRHSQPGPRSAPRPRCATYRTHLSTVEPVRGCMETDTDLLIIGAGPFGLAMAAYAKHLGLDHRLVGTPMESWKVNMPKGMYLRSACDWHLDPVGQDTSESFLKAQGLTAARHRSAVAVGFDLDSLR
jgi:hypothetical protein